MEFEIYPISRDIFISTLLAYTHELGINPGMIEVIPEGDIVKVVIQDNVAEKLNSEQIKELRDV